MATPDLDRRTIRRMIDSSGVPRKVIAELSGIPYNSLTQKLNGLATLTPENVAEITAVLRRHECKKS